MSSVGMEFCRQVVLQGDAGAICRYDFTEDDFLIAGYGEIGERELFSFLKNHTIQYGQVPTEAEILAGLSFRVGSDEAQTGSIDFWADQIIQRKLLFDAHKLSRELMQSIATVDFAAAKETVRNLYLNFQRRDMEAVRVRDLTVVGPEVLERHDQLQRQSYLTPGIPYGLEYLDCISGGMQFGDAITIVARPGVGKSQLALWIALHANVFAGRKVMFVTMEMPVPQCAARLLGIAAGVKTSSIRLGRLSFHAKARVQERLDGLIANNAAESFLFVEGGMSRQVEDIITVCRERRPDVMFIDGAYLLRTAVKRAAKWEIVTEVAEQIKSCALKMNIPIVSTYQFAKKGEKEGLSGIGLSDAIGQLGSFVVGLELLHDTRYEVEIRGNILKGREGERGWFEYTGNKITNVIRQTAYDRSVLFALTLDTEAESTTETSGIPGGDDAFLGDDA